MKRFRKMTAVLLTLVMLFSFSGNVFAASEQVSAKASNAFEISVYPEKAEYSKGEEIKFISHLKNNTGVDLRNVALVADVPETDTYLTRGASEAIFDTVEAGETVAADFRFSEYDAIVKIGSVVSAAGSAVNSVYSTLVREYNTIASLFLTLMAVVKSAFSDTVLHLFMQREKETLSTCKVIYDGKEIEFGFHVTYEKKLIAEEYKINKLGESDGAFSLDFSLSESRDKFSGLLFGTDIKSGADSGYIFFINPAKNKTGILLKEGEKFTLLAEKKTELEKGVSYDAKLVFDGKSAKIYLYNNPLDSEPFPVFDIPVSPFGGDIASYSLNSSSLSVSGLNEAEEYTGETYTNPVMNDGADPYVLYHDGVYYLYITNGYSWNGFEVWTSDNLVDWEKGGVIASKGDIIGSGNFWAPEVYYYNNQFYMFYSADEHTAVAVSSSPTGPFKKTSDSFLLDFNAIDANLLFDDDGRVYMYFSRIRHSEGEGQQIWGCELTSDLLSVKEGTLKLLCEPNKEWEGWVNEGPFMVKHGGTYYLTYSGDFYFNNGYSVGYATSSSPLGDFTKYENNPVLKSDEFVHGTGHHAFTVSPDGSEMFIVYHCHNTTTQVHDRKICIDRVKFTEISGSADVLTVYGPTVTAQPMPK